MVGCGPKVVISIIVIDSWMLWYSVRSRIDETLSSLISVVGVKLRCGLCEGNS